MSSLLQSNTYSVQFPAATEALAPRSGIGDLSLSRSPRLHTYGIQEIPFPLRGSGVKGEKPREPWQSILEDAEHVRDFLVERDELAVADPIHLPILVIFGTDFLQVAEEAAKMLLNGTLWVTAVIIAGGKGRFTPPEWESEAEEMKKVMRKRGVRSLSIYTDPLSKHTGQNAENTAKIIRAKHLGYKRPVVLMQWPMHQRRAAATLRKVLGTSVKVLSYAPFIPSFYKPLKGYSLPEWRRRLFLDVVGEPYRLIEYQKKTKNKDSFIVPVDIPDFVIAAAIRVGEFLQGDRSIPADYQNVLSSQLKTLREAA